MRITASSYFCTNSHLLSILGARHSHRERVSDDLLALDEALTKLAAEEPTKAELVKLRFFAGLTTPEAAKVLGISVATAERYWTYARVWLFAELNDSGPSPSA